MRAAVLTVAAFLLAGCAGLMVEPEKFNVTNSKEFGVSKDVLWERLIRYFATNNIQIKTVEKASGVVYAERITGAAGNDGKIGDLADCGKGFGQFPISHSMQMNVFVSEAGASRSKAQVTITYSESYDQVHGFGGPARECNSTGKMEGDILSALSLN